MADTATERTAPTPIEFKTSGGHTAKIKPFMSGFDDDAIKEVMMAGTNIKVKMAAGESHKPKAPRTAKQAATEDGAGPGGQEFDIPANKSIEARQKKIELMVLELDGDGTNVTDRVQALPVAERDEIIAEIDRIAEPLGDDPESAKKG